MTVRPYSTFRAYLKESTADMSAEEFMRSLARTLLERFSQYFQQVEVPFQDLSWKIGSFSRSCAAVLPALAALQPLHGEGKPPSAILSEIIPPLPSKPFRECGVEVPRTHEQAGKLAARLLRGLTPVLMVRSLLGSILRISKATSGLPRHPSGGPSERDHREVSHRCRARRRRPRGRTRGGIRSCPIITAGIAFSEEDSGIRIH